MTNSAGSTQKPKLCPLCATAMTVPEGCVCEQLGFKARLKATVASCKERLKKDRSCYNCGSTWNTEDGRGCPHNNPKCGLCDRCGDHNYCDEGIE